MYYIVYIIIFNHNMQNVIVKKNIGKSILFLIEPGSPTHYNHQLPSPTRVQAGSNHFPRIVLPSTCVTQLSCTQIPASTKVRRNSSTWTGIVGGDWDCQRELSSASLYVITFNPSKSSQVPKAFRIRVDSSSSSPRYISIQLKYVQIKRPRCNPSLKRLWSTRSPVKAQRCIVSPLLGCWLSGVATKLQIVVDPSSSKISA